MNISLEVGVVSVAIHKLHTHASLLSFARLWGVEHLEFFFFFLSSSEETGSGAPATAPGGGTAHIKARTTAVGGSSVGQTSGGQHRFASAKVLEFSLLLRYRSSVELRSPLDTASGVGLNLEVGICGVDTLLQEISEAVHLALGHSWIVGNLVERFQDFTAGDQRSDGRASSSASIVRAAHIEAGTIAVGVGSSSEAICSEHAGALANLGESAEFLSSGHTVELRLKVDTALGEDLRSEAGIAGIRVEELHHAHLLGSGGSSGHFFIESDDFEVLLDSRD